MTYLNMNDNICYDVAIFLHNLTSILKTCIESTFIQTWEPWSSRRNYCVYERSKNSYDEVKASNQSPRIYFKSISNYQNWLEEKFRSWLDFSRTNFKTVSMNTLSNTCLTYINNATVAKGKHTTYSSLKAYVCCHASLSLLHLFVLALAATPY